MPKLESRIVAIALGGILAIGLPAGFVLAAANHDARGDAVSAVASSTTTLGEAHGDAVSTAARSSSGGSRINGGIMPDRTVGGSTNAGSDAHGDAVSTIARDSSMVGGRNDNHGGAVSAVARKDAGKGVPPVDPDVHGDAVSVAARGTSTTGEARGDAVSLLARTH